jgi:serine/threonine protein kinase
MDEAKKKDQVIEIRVYQRLGDHPCIYKYIREDKDGIILERLGENLRKYLQRLLQDEKTVGFDQAVEWSCQAVEGLAYIHLKEILQGDIGCYNLLLDQDNHLKFCDFAGSSIDGEDLTVCCDTRYQPYTDNSAYPVTFHTELFGLGSLLYKIWTGSMPYQDESD